MTAWGRGGCDRSVVSARVRMFADGLGLLFVVFASVSAALSGGRVSSFGGFSGRDCVTLVVRSSALPRRPRGEPRVRPRAPADSIWKKSSASWHLLQTNVSRSTLPSMYMTWSSPKGIGPCCRRHPSGTPRRGGSTTGRTGGPSRRSAPASVRWPTYQDGANCIGPDTRCEPICLKSAISAQRSGQINWRLHTALLESNPGESRSSRVNVRSRCRACKAPSW